MVRTPGLIPARRHMWVEFVVGSRPCSEGFSPGSPVFLSPQQPASPDFNLTRIEDPYGNHLQFFMITAEIG